MAQDPSETNFEHDASAGEDQPQQGPGARLRWLIVVFLGVFTAVNVVLIVLDASTGVRLTTSGLVFAAALGAFIAVLLRRARD
ncbi:MAG: hypothetical protein ABTA24_02290 [Arthrobacter sp.]